MAIQSDADRITEIQEEMLDLLQEAEDLTRTSVQSGYPNLKAYVFDQIREHLSKCNPYNQDLEDVAKAIEKEIAEDDEEEVTDDENETFEDRDMRRGLHGPEYPGEKF